MNRRTRNAVIVLLSLTAVTAPVTVPAAMAAPAAVSEAVTGLPSLKQGSRGANVTALQHLLNANGARLKADGIYGAGTAAAVKSFQRSKGLNPDGIAGPKTLTAVTAKVRFGDRGDKVKALQTLLNTQGNNLAVDGSFGGRTKGAVETFQRAKNLSVDGIVGPKTWGALLGGGKVAEPPVDNKQPVKGDVTLNDLKAMFPGKVANTPRVQEGLAQLNAEMRKGDITNPQRKAAFLATLANESLFDYAVNEHGQTATYRGRGYIQLTSRANYQSAGSYLGINLVGNPSLAADKRYSAAIARWYWVSARSKSNEAADRFDMGKISTYVGYRANSREDAERCADFKRAYRHLSGKNAPASTICYRH